MNINYEDNKHFSYYEIDAYLTDYHLGIEIMGEYWHGDNRIYKQISKMQLQSAYRDKRKKTFIKNKENFYILYLCESDINNDIDLCYYLIKKYIDQNGRLDNYHSFNYSLKNDEPILNQNLIIPYMEWDKNDLIIILK